jgi:tetratricopeptide (TPR) repeat protein
MIDVRDSRIGVIGDNARIEGGIHFHEQPTGPPLQLPRRPDHFTGRRQEVEDLMAALRPGHVATLWGPGGIGKSAVAAEALHRLTADGTEPPAQFPDGIVWHEFYNAPEALRALEHIARSFGQTPDPTPREAALRALAGRNALLLLDGAEDADDLPAVLDVAGGCAVIVTTRNRHDAGPHILEINALPDDESADLLKAWGRDQTRDAPAVRRICDLLGGLPLALCLAGGYLDETGDTAPEYLQWLETTPLDALDQGDRKRDSVPILIKRNLDQVSQTARDILSIAGILAFAPFNIGTLCTALQTPGQAIKRPLNELTGYCLLSRDGFHYQLRHVLIHAYASKKQFLPDKTLDNLAQYYILFTRKYRTKNPPCNSFLASERPHIIQTITTCLDRQQWNNVHGLAASIDRFLEMKGYWADRMTILNAGINATREMKNLQNQLTYMGRLGTTCRLLGHVEKAIKHHQEALMIAQEIGDRDGETNQLIGLGNDYSVISKMPEAIEHYQQALTIAQEIGDRSGEGACLGNLGLYYNDLGQVEKAIEYHKQALTIAQEIGDQRKESAFLGNLGISYRTMGHVKKAIALHHNALRIAQQIGDRECEGSQLGSLGIAYRDLDQAQTAVKYIQQALKIAQEIGDRHMECNQLNAIGIAYSSLGKIKTALECYQKALIIAREIGDRQAEGNQLNNLGCIYRDQNEKEKARDFYQKALTIAREIGDRKGEGSRLNNLGLVYRDLGDTKKAIELIEQAASTLKQIKSPKADGVEKYLYKLKAQQVPVYVSPPHRGTDQKRETKANIQYQEAMKEYQKQLEAWKKWPFWKRRKAGKPKKPEKDAFL